jgi:glycosyltransferase involved in cell wall biosynthesis
MNPIYLAEAGWLWKLMGKKIGLWYTHRNVDLKLRIAEKFTDVIFTAAKESFNLPSNKVMIVGHGIDVSLYTNVQRTKPLGSEPVPIASIGRITPIKDPITLIEAAHILRLNWQKKFTLVFIGSPIMGGDEGYSKKVHDLVGRYELEGIVTFAGDVKPADLVARYASFDLTINLVPTGGLDRVVLESMASGVPVITSNMAFKDYLGAYAGRLTFERGNAEDLANKIMSLFDSGQAVSIGKDLQKVAKEKADVASLIRKISESLT